MSLHDEDYFDTYNEAYEKGYDACLNKYAWMLEGLLYDEDLGRVKK